jgi:predicted nucleotidyltransferase
MTIDKLKKNNLLLLDCLSGSRAYGLHTPQSDTDMKGVFILSKRVYYGLEYTEQVNNETNDEVYYELKRFVDLLVKNNPNIIECFLILSTSIIRHTHHFRGEFSNNIY